MGQIIDEILSDLYKLDKSLMEHDKDLRKTIEKIIKEKPNTGFDESFKKRLGNELLLRAEELKAQHAVRKNKSTGFLAKFSNLKNIRLVPVGMSALAIVLIFSLSFLGWKYYQRGGGNIANIFSHPKEVKFALTPMKADVLGIQSDSSFILKTSENLTEKEVQNLVAFSPKVDFTVKRIDKNISFLATAIAAAESTDFSVAAQYEIKVNGELEQNKVYKIAVNDKSFADRDYGWAFQVKAPFSVVENYPRNKATLVALNTGIELTFNRPLPENAKDFFDISPKVEGKFEIKNDKLYFIPSELSAKTIYTVTLKKGLSSKVNSQELLDKEYSFVFETDAKDKDDSDQENAGFYGEEYIETNPDMNPLIGIYIDDENIEDDFDVNIYQFRDKNDFMDSLKSSDSGDLYWTYFSLEKDLDDYRPKADRKMLSFKAKAIKTNVDNLSSSSYYLEVPQKLEEGYYFFDIKREETEFGGWLQSSKIVHYSSMTSGTSLMWLYDFAKKNPVQNAKISLLDGDSETDLAKTDGEGLAKYETPDVVSDEIYDGHSKFIQISADGYKDFIMQTSSDRIDRGDRYWDYVATDRYLYQPTDEIHYWAALKGRGNDVTGKDLIVGIYSIYPSPNIDGEKIEPIISEKKKVSEFGTLEGSIKLDGFSPNSYYLIVMDGQRIVSDKFFRVETYTKPAYKIEVSSPKFAVSTGETVEFNVKAEFFDGTPASNVKLKYFSYGGYNIEGGITLDKNGEGKISYTPDYQKPEEDDSWDRYPENLTVEFYPEFSEEGDIFGRASVMVFGPNKKLTAFEEDKKNGEYEFKALLNNINHQKLTASSGDIYQIDSNQYIDGVSQDTEISAKIIKLTYTKEEIGEYYDYVTRTTKKIYNYKENEEEIEKLSGKTNSNGEWSFSRKLDFSGDVRYRVDFRGLDEKGKVFKDSVAGFERTNNTNSFNPILSSNGRDGQNVWDNEKVFSLNDDVKLHLDVEEDKRISNAKVLFYRYQNDIDEAKIVSDYDFSETFKEEFAPNVQYRAVVLSPYGFGESNPVSAVLDRNEKKLNIEIIPEKKNYEPGAEVKVDLKVTDKDRNPAKANINISVVDQSMFENQDPWNENILRKLYDTINVYPTVDYTQYQSYASGDGRGGGGDSRDSFLDVVFFESVQTDSNGKASIKFRVPDNITSWRIDAWGYDAETTQAGESYTLIPVSIPFFVDVTMKQTYLVGDSPEIRVRTFGSEYDSNQGVTYSVISESLAVNSHQTVDGNTAFISLGALIQGQHDIKITAKQGNKSDTIERTIDVTNGYAKKIVSNSYPLSEKLSSIEGNASGVTKLVFVNNGKGKYYQKLLQAGSDSGVRSDQIVAKLYGRELLKEYFGENIESDELNLDSFYACLNENCEEKGISLLPSGEIDLETSAKISDIAGDRVYRQQLKEYFTSVMYNNVTDIHRVSKALYGLASIGEPVLAKINYVRNYNSELTLEDKIYLGLALVKSGDAETARELYENEIRNSVQFDSNQARILATDQNDNVKLTATLAVLAADLGLREDTKLFWNHVSTSNPERDLDILEEVMIAKEYLLQVGNEESSFRLKTNKRAVEINLKNKDSYEINLPKDELVSLSISDVKGNVEMISSYEKLQELDSSKNDSSLALSREYLVDGKSATTLKDGDLVRIRMNPRFLASANNGSYQVTDALPSGLKPATRIYSADIYEDEGKIDYCDKTWYPDSIDGNLVSFSLDRNYMKTHDCSNLYINYYARVSSKGIFKADSAILQSIDDPGRYYATEQKGVEIK